jgi:hypothetical protein
MTKINPCSRSQATYIVYAWHTMKRDYTKEEEESQIMRYIEITHKQDIVINGVDKINKQWFFYSSNVTPLRYTHTHTHIRIIFTSTSHMVLI